MPDAPKLTCIRSALNSALLWIRQLLIDVFSPHLRGVPGLGQAIGNYRWMMHHYPACDGLALVVFPVHAEYHQEFVERLQAAADADHVALECRRFFSAQVDRPLTLVFPGTEREEEGRDGPTIFHIDNTDMDDMDVGSVPMDRTSSR